jgi:cold shock CspA family protein
MKGTVKWYDQSRGYGFLRLDESEETTGDVYLNARQVGDLDIELLSSEQAVEFDVLETPRGKIARNVRIIKSAKNK